ncbi:MAG: hypothetical protein N2Z79_05400, partial [Candidatus Omnitrophica bacterium]|nr:hypothetical protein [Candidatus Omnitrophota bacterium]
MVNNILIQMGIEGSEEIFNLTKQSLKEEILRKREATKVEFPETNYFFPLINALINIEIKTLGDCELALKEIEKLMDNKPTNTGLFISLLNGVFNKAIAGLLCEEILAGLYTCLLYTS